jgi:hypothetical protein
MTENVTKKQYIRGGNLFKPDDDYVYLKKLQREGVTKCIILYKNVDQPKA